MKNVYLFCDGSSLGNPGRGGWCAILQYKDKEKILSGNAQNVTNNQMELRAVIEGLKALKEPCNIELVCDSLYVLNGISQWLPNWIKKDFAKVKNAQMWQEYCMVSKNHHINTQWVRGHSGHALNEKCDSIAKARAEELSPL